MILLAVRQWYVATNRHRLWELPTFCEVGKAVFLEAPKSLLLPPRVGFHPDLSNSKRCCSISFSTVHSPAQR